jgi:hypothetical protein
MGRIPPAMYMRKLKLETSNFEVSTWNVSLLSRLIQEFIGSIILEFKVEGRIHIMSNATIKLTTAILLITAFLSALPGSAHAQGNLLENPGFDSDLSVWLNLYDRRSEWSMMDAANSPSSGSAEIFNESAPSNGGTPIVLEQCVPILSSHEYKYGGQFRIPEGMPEGTSARIFLRTYSLDDCTGDTLQSLNTDTPDVDKWTMVNESLVTDSDALSLWIGLGVFKPNGESELASAYFDNLFIHRADTGGKRIINEKLSGTWYDLATSGQGFVIDIAPSINTFFAGWYTWTNTAGEIVWFTLQGGFTGDTASLMIYRTSGGKFNDPTAVTSVAVGVAEIYFTSCTEAVLSFKFDDESEFTVINLSKLTPAFKGCVD